MIRDYATTAMASGKVQVAAAKGESVPITAVLDSEGRPSTNPNDFMGGGSLQPVGAHKGYALALLIDALSNCLTGAEDTDRGYTIGVLAIAINPEVWRPRADYHRAVDDLFDRMKSTPTAPGFEEVLIPGEPERRAREVNARRGIELAEATATSLRRAAEQLGVDPGAVDAARMSGSPA